MFVPLLEKLGRHEDLTGDEAAAAMGAIMDGQAQPSHIAALLIGLSMKGERPREMAGFATAMRDRAVKLPVPAADVFDTCGTGGDGAHTFNISTAAAIVLAGCGVKVAKHGNRAASSRCGSADVFEVLGVNLEAPAATVVEALHTANIAFFFAPHWHPSMRHAGPTRRELGVRTAFNLLGPLCNPAHATRQLVGVPRPEQTELLARALGALGSVRAWVVHGADGLDEVSTTGYTKVSEYAHGTVHTFYLHPADAGLPRAKAGDLAGGTAEENAAIITSVLDGQAGPRRDIVLLNAGAALLIAGVASSIGDGVGRAAEAIDSGRARQALETLIRVCHR
jgi:anthranilate phosphoribosyltransferase